MATMGICFMKSPNLGNLGNLQIGKPDLDGKAGSSSKPSTAQKLKKFICKRRKIEKSSQAPLASGVEFSSSGTSSSSASSDNEGAHGTDLTAVCGMSKIMPKPFFKPRLSARIDDHSIEWYTLGNEIVLDIKLCGYRYLMDHLFPDHLLNGCIVFNKGFGGKSYLQCTTIGEEITITIGGNSLFEFISMNRSQFGEFLKVLNEMKIECHNLFDLDGPLDLTTRQ
ncbi:hypothetical protein Fcan01_28724 [Folsomia candida]|uniref:Uncharacterized protein n=1 Tax=Folsomia candida TaxID=158441 RepID=A0A226CVY3_FOLCA|nr:hypothetical protein Fcan01_28724 [Folsomia candida]